MANDPSVRGASAAGAAYASSAYAPPPTGTSKPADRLARTLLHASSGSLTGNPGAAEITVTQPSAPRGGAPESATLDVGDAELVYHHSQPHVARDVGIPIAGQLFAWAGGSALLGYGAGRMAESDATISKNAAGWVGGVVSVAGLIFEVIYASKQSHDAPKHAEANSGIRWTKALAWGGAGAVLALGASAGIPVMERNRRFEVLDRVDMPDHPFPHEDQYMVISPTIKGNSEKDDIRAYIYRGDPIDFDAVTNQTQAAHNDFLGYKPIKNALIDKKKITVKFNKTAYDSDGSISKGDNFLSLAADDLKGPETPLSISLADIWGSIEKPSFSIKKSDRVQYSKLGAHRLRLDVHARLIVKYQNPDFLEGFKNKSKINDDRYQMAAAVFEVICKDSFKHPLPALLKARAYDVQGRTIENLFSIDDLRGTKSACVDKPCTVDGEKSFVAMVEEVIAQKGLQTLYDAVFGDPSKQKTKDANSKVIDALPQMFETIEPSPTPKPSPQATPSAKPSPSPSSAPDSSPAPTVTAEQPADDQFDDEFDPNTQAPSTAAGGNDIFDFDPKKPKKPKTKAPGKASPSKSKAPGKSGSSGSKSSGKSGSSKSSGRK
jgi:hypothetical protein